MDPFTLLWLGKLFVGAVAAGAAAGVVVGVFVAVAYLTFNILVDRFNSRKNLATMKGNIAASPHGTKFLWSARDWKNSLSTRDRIQNKSSNFGCQLCSN